MTGRAGERIWGSSEPDLQLEEAVAGRRGECFRGRGRSGGGSASEAQVDLLYRQIGQLKVENDLYEGLGVKQDAVLLCAAMTAAL